MTAPGFNLQRELYNLLQGSQLGSCSRKISNADWLVDRSFSNEPVNDRSLNNLVSSLLHNSNDQLRRRDAKAQEKLLVSNNLTHNLNDDNRFETSAGIFNLAGGSFKPKDNSEGTLLSIQRLRKNSLQLPETKQVMLDGEVPNMRLNNP